MSKVSALISAYFAEPFLDARITNLFGVQKGIEVEPIVVCQGGSAEDKIASKYNVKVIRTVDIPTIGVAWNIAAKNAYGDYLTTANTDDRYLIGGLKKMADVLDEHPEIGLVFSQVDLDDGNIVYPWKRIENGTGEVKEIKAILSQRCIIGSMPLWRRSIHNQVGKFNDMVVASDYDMWLRMARAGVRFWYIDESCGVYMKRPNSLEYRNKDLGRLEARMVRG